MATTRTLRTLARELPAQKSSARFSAAALQSRYASSASTSTSTSTSIPKSSPSQLDPPSSLRGSSSSSTSFGNTIASINSSPSASEEATGSSTASDTSGLKASLLSGIAKVMGYNNTTATAIRATSDYYDRCAERDEREATFFYDECGLPQSYQTWMSVTNLHIWLLSVRFRSLPAPLGKTYIQETINHYFIHSESLMRGRYKVKQGRLIKGYMRDQLYQYHGANMGYDEGMVSGDDAILASAVWRNLFGAGWGRMGGVKGKLNQDNKSFSEVGGAVPEEKEEQDPIMKLNLDPSLPPSPEIPNQAGGYHAGGSGLVEPLPANASAKLDGVHSKEARFALNLERLVRFIRREVNRMEKLDDQTVMRGITQLNNVELQTKKGSLMDFSRI